MTRVVLEALLFLVVPFILFAGWLVARRQPIMAKESWEGLRGWLTVVGLALVIAAITIGAVFEPRRTGEYVPAHMDNGRLVPGQFR
ncbi:MAG: DUF6111 family protein [Beijerinckiaceae bacterium]